MSESDRVAGIPVTKQLAIVVLMAALAGCGAGVATTLALNPTTGPRGEPGAIGPRGHGGPAGPRGPEGPESDYALDWDEVWQAIEDDPSRLQNVIDSNGIAITEEEDPLAKSICDGLFSSSVEPLEDVYYSAC